MGNFLNIYMTISFSRTVLFWFVSFSQIMKTKPDYEGKNRIFSLFKNI